MSGGKGGEGRIECWGKSAVLRLPAGTVGAAGFLPGEALDVVVGEGQVILRRQGGAAHEVQWDAMAGHEDCHEAAGEPCVAHRCHTRTPPTSCGNDRLGNQQLAVPLADCPLGDANSRKLLKRLVYFKDLTAR